MKYQIGDLFITAELKAIIVGQNTATHNGQTHTSYNIQWYHKNGRIDSFEYLKLDLDHWMNKLGFKHYPVKK